MTFFRACCIALWLTGSVFAFSGKAPADSRIPDRRDFPVNSKVNPCENFYEYACSEAVSRFKLREDRSKHVFSFSDSHERLLEAKKSYLESLTKDGGQLEGRAQALKNIFQACMNEKASAAEEKDLVAKISTEVKNLSDRKAFQDYLSARIGTPDFSFIDWGTLGNHKDSDWNDVYFLADIQSLPERSYYSKPDVLADLEALARSFFETLGFDKPAERAKWVVDFETEFSKTYPTPAEIRELINTPTSISRQKLVKQYPALGLDRLLARIPTRTHLRHLTPKNFEFVNSQLSQAPLEVLKSVYLFHSVPRYMDDAYPEYFQKSFEFSKKHLGGPNVRPVRKERCTTYVMHKFDKEIDELLLPKVFPSFPEKRFIELAEKVRSSILDGIKNNQWLSAQSKAAAIKKIQLAPLQLVKPQTEAEWNFNPPAEYSAEKPYNNNRVLEKNLIDKEIRELAQKRDRKRWEMGPLTVNAYYSPPDNKFVMPIGILQYPFYDPKLPDSTNLGAVGMVIGHELGHAIDDQGAKYDHGGRMAQWMSAKDVKEFVKRGQGLVGQFEKTGHNGKLTLGENIGDLVGMTFAYKAAFPEGKGEPKAKQDFFLQYARAWCGVIRPKYRERLLKTDPHALFDARVNEQVKHQQAFQEAFGCKEGDPMVLPANQRIQIW